MIGVCVGRSFPTVDRDTVNVLAREKACGSLALQGQWRLALDRLASLGLPEAELVRLARACPSPGAASRLARLLAADPAGSLETLLRHCDGSSHGLPQWIEALDALYGWLERRSLVASLEASAGYIACSSAAAPEADLASTVLKMLDDYGMDEATKS